MSNVLFLRPDQVKKAPNGSYYPIERSVKRQHLEANVVILVDGKDFTIIKSRTNSKEN